MSVAKNTFVCCNVRAPLGPATGPEHASQYAKMFLFSPNPRGIGWVDVPVVATAWGSRYAQVAMHRVFCREQSSVESAWSKKSGSTVSKLWAELGLPHDIPPPPHFFFMVHGSEFDKALLRGWLTGAPCTARRAYDRGLRDSLTCPYCGQAQEDDEHWIWVCVEWKGQREAYWRPRQARSIGLEASYTLWPVCLKICGLMPAHCRRMYPWTL